MLDGGQRGQSSFQMLGRKWDVASVWLGWWRELEEEEKGRERKNVLISPSCFCLHLFR